MANTYTSLHYHGIFSTKNREPWLQAEIEQRVWALIGGIVRAHKMTASQVDGIEDHIHALGDSTTDDRAFPDRSISQRRFF